MTMGLAELAILSEQGNILGLDRVAVRRLEADLDIFHATCREKTEAGEDEVRAKERKTGKKRVNKKRSIEDRVRAAIGKGGGKSRRAALNAATKRVGGRAARDVMLVEEGFDELTARLARNKSGGGQRASRSRRRSEYRSGRQRQVREVSGQRSGRKRKSVELLWLSTRKSRRTCQERSQQSA